MSANKNAKRVRIPKFDGEGKSYLVGGKTYYLRTAMNVIMDTLKHLEKKGIIESLSVQKNLINVNNTKPRDFVSFKIKKYVI